MPKRSRQSHVPSQARKRRSRGPATESFQTGKEPAPGTTGASADLSAAAESGAVEGPTSRRLDSVSQSRARARVRATAGQLPLYEPGYLAMELKQIALISASLMGVVLLLAVLLR